MDHSMLAVFWALPIYLLTGHSDAAEVHFSATYGDIGLIGEDFSQHIRVGHGNFHPETIVDNDAALPVVQYIK